jgi:replicative DNA helicase
VDTLPRHAFDIVRAAMRDRGITHRSMRDLRGKSYAVAPAAQHAMSRRLAAEYAEILGDAELLGAATNDLFWDRILEVSIDGDESVFDLTVPGLSSWLADSVVSHNSGALEQDSDVVMFIHREDMYSDDPSVKGIADCVVAKHRNGPIDKVRLTFLSHLTQFKDYARAS